MAREALLIANSVSQSASTRGVTSSVLQRTVTRFASLLEDLPSPYNFHVKKLVNARAKDVRNMVEIVAEGAASTRDLFLFYYFGHGTLSAELELQFVHPGADKDSFEYLKLSTIENVVNLTEVTKSLFIIDCCYAGAQSRTFPTSLRREHCRIASTTPSARAYIVSNLVDDPIGTFTRSVLDGFSSVRACRSATDNTVTAESLFRYAKDQTYQRTSGVQNPTILGTLSEPLSEYQPRPDIIPGLSKSADEKTTYYKILAICRTLNDFKSASDMEMLYKAVLSQHPSAFKTLYKLDDGRFTYLPVQQSVVARYVRLLRALGLIDETELKLSSSGRNLVSRWRTSYNQRLLESIDKYLERAGLTRDDIERALRDILSGRGVPSRSEVLDYLALSRRLPRDQIGIILDLLGHIRAVRMSPSRAYFPW